MNVAPNEDYEAVLDAGESGLAGTVGLFVHNNTDEVVTEFSAADVTEIENPPGTPTGVYTTVRTAPPLVGQYTIVWQRGDGGETMGTDDLTVEARLGDSLVAIGDEAPNYITLEELSGSLELDGTGFADLDLKRAIASASRGIDGAANRRFYLDADDQHVRYYSPLHSRRVEIDDLVTLTEVAVDASGSGSFGGWSLNSDFVLNPLNAAAKSRPYEEIELLGSLHMRGWQARSVRVTGQFGWPVVPSGVMTATSILAHRLLRRRREAPFGILAVGLDTGAVMRLAKSDPDVMFALDGLCRETALA